MVLQQELGLPGSESVPFSEPEQFENKSVAELLNRLFEETYLKGSACQTGRYE